MQLTAKTLTGRSLRIDDAKPCDTGFVTNQLKNRAVVADHTPWTLPLTVLFKSLPWNPSEFRSFEHELPVLLALALTVNLSLLWTPMFWFVWPHFASSLVTCVIHNLWPSIWPQTTAGFNTVCWATKQICGAYNKFTLLFFDNCPSTLAKT